MKISAEDCPQSLEIVILANVRRFGYIRSIIRRWFPALTQIRRAEAIEDPAPENVVYIAAPAVEDLAAGFEGLSFEEKLLMMEGVKGKLAAFCDRAAAAGANLLLIGLPPPRTPQPKSDFSPACLATECNEFLNVLCDAYPNIVYAARNLNAAALLGEAIRSAGTGKHFLLGEYAEELCFFIRTLPEQPETPLSPCTAATG